MKRQTVLFLRKELPKQGAKITEWKLGEDRIELTLESGRYVRVHDAVLRLKKVLSEQLGKKYRIGIRGIEVESFTIQVPAEHELRMLKVPYIKGMENIEGGILLELEVGEAEMKNRSLTASLPCLKKKIEAARYGAKAEHWNLIWQREPMKHPFNEDPTQAMLKEAGSKEGQAAGSGSMGPSLREYSGLSKKIVFDELLEPSGTGR